MGDPKQSCLINPIYLYGPSVLKLLICQGAVQNFAVFFYLGEMLFYQYNLEHLQPS